MGPFLTHPVKYCYSCARGVEGGREGEKGVGGCRRYSNALPFRSPLEAFTDIALQGFQHKGNSLKKIEIIKYSARVFPRIFRLCVACTVQNGL